jgi:large subunit ribosomal protein L6
MKTMSRVGLKPVTLPKGVEASVNGRTVRVKGPKGELSFDLVHEITAEMREGQIVLTPLVQNQRMRALWGMHRNLINNLVIGVSRGYTKTLEINGVGYRAQAQGKKLQLQLGFSHDIIYDIPAGIEIKTPKPTEITISGIVKQKVGQVAAEIRAFRGPEPYKGKGVKYAEEHIFRKEGKKK